MAAIPPDKWVSWRRHKVDEGETLAGIAAQVPRERGGHGRCQRTRRARSARGWQQADYPGSRASAVRRPGKLVRYRVRTGDTLQSVADEFDVSAAELRKWNHLRGAASVARGMRLTIYPAERFRRPLVAGEQRLNRSASRRRRR